MQNRLSFNFVVDLPESELAACAAAPDLAALLASRPDMLARISSKGDLCWCLQSYLILKPRGMIAARLSNRLVSDSLNIVHSDQLLNLRGIADDFVVCIRADFPRRRWAHYHLVQNRAQFAAETACLPLWPQPALIGRNADRDGVTTIAYAGETTNGNLAANVKTWQRLFAPFGLRFVQMPSHAWHDLSAIDVILGIRSFDHRRYDGKPPSKMLNAWHGGIPFIGGYDSAFTQLGTPGRDYLRVGSADEALQAVLRLRDNPLLYSLLVRNGRRRAAEFTTEAIAVQWEQVLLGQVRRRHARWQERRFHETVRSHLLLALGLAEHNERQVIKGGLRWMRTARTHRDAALAGSEAGRD